MKIVSSIAISLLAWSVASSTVFGATATQSGNWSDSATWGGSAPSGNEEDCVIPAGITVTLDTSDEVGEIRVMGKLTVATGTYELICDSLIVMGANSEFEVGTTDERYSGDFTLTLKGEQSEGFEHGLHAMGWRALVALDGGVLNLHGEDRVEWTRLDANVDAGSTSITMAEAVDWREGDELKYLPTNQGFDSYYGIPYSNDMFPASTMKYADDCLFLEGESHETMKEAFAGKLRNGFNPVSMKNKVPLMRDEECIEFPADQTTITRRFTDEGIAFISESVKEEKPFFLYLAHSMPHIPLFVSPEFEGKSERGLYGDVIEEIDFNTGRVLDHLKALGVEDNTLVIFTSDNGPWLAKEEAGGSALPLFEGKFTTFEGGRRVPCVMKWPGRIPAGTVCDELAATIDLLPTFAAITGAALPTVQPLDGKDILDLLTHKPGAKSPHEYFFYNQSAVRHGDWKYHSRESFRIKETAREHKGPTLYNLKDDIGESNNVINEYPEIAARLAKVLESNPNKRVDDRRARSKK